MSNTSSDRNLQTHPLDIDLPKRNVTARWIVLIVYILVSFTLFFSLGIYLGEAVFDSTPLIKDLTITIVPLSGTALAASGIESLFIIRNPTTGMFVTIDQLRSLFRMDKVNVYYGPGSHVAFPWEKRLQSNNISLEEASNGFEWRVQLKNGTLHGRGSFRMRPDLKNPVAFLTGVASIADEITDLIVALIAEFFQGMTVREGVNKYTELNTFLSEKFQSDAKDKIEQRYGVIISDATVRELLPSQEVQRTLSGVTEAEAVQEGTELLLGLKKGTLNDAVEKGRVQQPEVKEARDRFLSISGNLEGMDIRRYEFAISGLDPKLAEALAQVFKSPGGQALMASIGGKTKSGRKPSQQKPTRGDNR